MAKALPISTSWWELISERAALTPDSPYISDEQGRVMTFGQYKRFAEETAAGLLKLGVLEGDVVSWQLPSTLEATVLMAALCRLGVRQNPIIPILRQAEVNLITTQVESSWLIVPGTYRNFDYVELAKASVDEAKCKIINLADYSGDTELALPRADPGTLSPAVDPGDEVRSYYYSSGTTATAKGAKHTEASTMASSNTLIEYIKIRDTDKLPVPFPITHIGGIMLLTAYLRAGGQILFIETFDAVKSPLVMAENGATFLGSATPFFHAYLAAQRNHGDEPLFTELRQLHAGGAPITSDLNAECMGVFGTPIYNQWGLTEFPAATSLAEGDPPEKFEGSVGRMAPGAEAKTVGFDGEVTAAGEEGELWVRGPQSCKGYVDSALDEAAFDSEGFFRSGDLGVIDSDGFITITGRLKDIIIRNAENISAQEIEDVLSEHPAIADIAVIGIPDARTGERACALVVLAEGYDDITIPQIAEHCAAKGLAKQKTPEGLAIMDELPRNPMGKVLKHLLRSQFADK